MRFLGNLIADRSQNKRLFAFTLLELIVVLGIMAVLTGIITIATVPARQQSRDSRRIENVKDLAIALELYFQTNKTYPDGNGCIEALPLSSILVPTYISSIASDPLYNATSCSDVNSVSCYCTIYQKTGSGANATYTLTIHAEKASALTKSVNGRNVYEVDSSSVGSISSLPIASSTTVTPIWGSYIASTSVIKASFLSGSAITCEYGVDSTWTSAGMPTQKGTVYTCSIAPGLSGSHIYRMRGTNSAGQTIAAATASLTVDSTAPSVSSFTATSVGGTVNLSWSASDSQSGFGSSPFTLIYSTSQSARDADTTCSGSGTSIIYSGLTASFTQGGLGTGTYYYRLCAVDNAGNINYTNTTSALVQILWLNNPWQYRKAITVTNPAGNGDLTNYQVAVTNPIMSQSGLVASYHFEGTQTSTFATSTVTTFTLPGESGSWTKRMPITLTDATALSYYQTQITVTYNASMKADFSDVRFTDFGGSTQLPYWIASYTASSSAVFWVKVPSISTTGTTIFMYYGNASATTTSNTQTTFDFYDDFSDGNYTSGPAWTVNSGSFSASSGYLKSTQGQVDMSISATGLNIPGGYAYRLDYDLYAASTYCDGMEVVAKNASDSKRIGAFTDQCAGRYMNVEGNGSIAQGTYSLPVGVWKHMLVYFNGSQYIMNFDNGAYTLALTASQFTDTITKLQFSGWQHSAGNSIDNVIIRKYAAAEPSIAFGTEQIPTGGTVITFLFTMPITIYSVTALTNYQVKMTIPYYAGMNGDFSDLRFFTASGTAITYWTESVNAWSSAVVWLRVPSLIAGNTIVNLYYGNGMLTTGSDFTNTFDAFGNWYENWKMAQNTTCNGGGFEQYTFNDYSWTTLATVNTDFWPSCDNCDIYVRKKFMLPSVSTSTVTVASDDGQWVYANGTQKNNCGCSSCHCSGPCTATTDVTSALRVGENVVATRCTEAASGETCQVNSFSVPGARLRQYTATEPTVTFGARLPLSGLTDSSDNGNTLMFMGGAALGSGKYGMSMSNPGGAFAMVGSSTSLSSPSSAITIEAWVRLDSLSSKNWNAISYKDEGVRSWYLGFFPGRADALHWSNAGLSIWNVDCVIPSALNTWRHIVATYQNGVGRRVYVDGSLICSDAASGTLPTSSAPVTIGGAEKELIDDFKIYNRALSLAEVQAEYSHQKTDYSDIRFTSSDGTTEIPFWQENDNKFWINVPSVANGGTSTVYAYYGNLSAGSLSNGDSTFDFFDGFDVSGIDTNKWNIIDSTGFSAGNGYLRGSNTTGRIASIKTFSSGVVQEEKAETELIAPNGSMMGGFYISSSNNIGWLDHPTTSYYRNDVTWVPKGIKTSTTNSFLYATTVKNGTTVNLQMYNIDTQSSYWAVGDLTNTVSNEPIVFGRRYDDDVALNNQSYNTDWDWVRIRKYAANTPAAVGGSTTLNTSFGSEEANSVLNPNETGWSYRKPITITNNSGSVLSDYQVLVQNPVYDETGLVGSWSMNDLLSSNNFMTTDGTSWGYRTPIIVNSAAALTNYQVKIPFNYASGMRSDFGDVRFTDGSGNLYSYWIESYTASSSAVFWILMPLIAAGNNYIYMYYGNPSVAASSSPAIFTVNNIYAMEGTDGGTYPANHADFNTVKNTLPANIGTKYVNQIYWGSVWDNSGVTANVRDAFYSRFRFLFVADTTGTWTFAVDSDDSSELILSPGDPTLPVGETVVASWYGSHGWCNCTSYSGTVYLTAGQAVWMDYAQMELNGGEAAVVRVLRPGGSWNYLSSANFPNLFYARQYAASEPTVTVLDPEVAANIYITDSSIYHNNGLLVGSPSLVDGVFGNAMQFNGGNTYYYLDIPSSTAFDNQNFTISAWVYSNNYNQNGSIFEKGVVNSQYSLFFEGASLCFRSYDSSGGINSLYTTQAALGITAGNWYNIVATYDGSYKRIYVNGVLKNSVAWSATMATAKGGERIGAYGGGSPAYFYNGLIDEVKVYSRALSTSEIQQRYGAKGSPDYSDIRFATGSGTSLSYWKEADGRFWVKIPSIAIGANTIYAYYGNPNASSASNGSSTFQYFQSNATAFSGWSSISQSFCGGTPMNGGYNKFGNGANSQVTVSALAAGTYKLEFNYYFVDSWDNEYGRAYFDGSQIWSQQWMFNNGIGNICGRGVFRDYLPNSRYAVTATHAGGDATIKFDSTLDDLSWDESWGVDNILLRKYASPEPTASVTPGTISGEVLDLSFNEGKGLTSFDVSGNSNTASLISSPIWAAGKTGWGMNFNSSSQYLQVPNSASLNNGSVTISMWAYLSQDPNCDVNSNWRYLLIKSGAFQFIMEEARSVTFDTFNPASDRWWPTGLSVPIGQWTHLIFTFDASTGIKTAYQDGVSKGSHTAAASGAITSNTNPLDVSYPSTSCPNGLGYFPGTVDDVRIFNRVLSPTEINSLFLYNY